MRIQVV